ncbi:hypothetical protein [Dyadobacter psychrotolerans]|uniref:Uncharacterized protein n=1 Tax=Dyadobacter psychrotolerans TaxID=2541721 RepID=A0A4R5DZR6_9BACT|nr:hypothetical protein [Dyadobacter psychrotolerans]TDE17701.1 hypothetical protein E0F88_07370 [Dyadobacter psychrotolerans]
MPLKPNQVTILPNTLYEVTGSGYSVDAIAPNIEVIGGSVGIYGSQVQPGTAPTGMYQTATAFTGIDYFVAIPNYLYVSGTATSIVVTGLLVKAV